MPLLTSPSVVLDDAGSQTTRSFADPIAIIEAHGAGEVPDALARIETARRDGLYVAGYISYELSYALEHRLLPLLWPKRKLPLLWFGVFDRVEQHAFNTMEPDDSVQPCRAYAGPLDHEWTADAHQDRFNKIQHYINAGDVYQVNLSFRSRFAFHGDPWAFYIELRRHAGQAHCAYVDDGTHHILSASPELFFDLSSQGILTTRPMKGTAPRGTDEASDQALRERLAASEKNRAENLMIVDLMRNDVGHIARIGSVAVKNLFAIESYPTVHQMVSTITGRMRPDVTSGDIIRALFPCGSVTGAPKLRATEIIRELETSPRGAYCGAIGAFMPDGSARFNVAIRTVTIAGNQGELGIGGGIVHESRADDEYAECLLKARHYEVARRPIELIETLLYSPEAGFVRGTSHLDRLAESAGTFGIAFDRAAVEQTMNPAVQTAPGATRVRVMLPESGEITIATTPFTQPTNQIWRYAISPRRVSSNDALLRHKTTWRELYESEMARLADECGCDEVLFMNELGQLTEGTRTNLFVQMNDRLLTPPLSAALLNGRLRNEMLADGRCEEAQLYPDDLQRAQQVFLGNSLRGLILATPVTSH